MDIVIVDENRKKEWEEYLYNNPYTVAWQSFEWSNVLRKEYKNVTFIPIAAYQGQNVVGILPLYHVRIPFSVEKLISVPYAVAGGVSADSHDIQVSLLGKAIEISAKYGNCSITLKNYKMKVMHDLTTDDNYYNNELQLTNNTDAILEKISEKNRMCIEEASKFEFTLEYPSLDIDRYYKMLSRCLHNKGIPCVSASWIRNLISFNLYSIALVKKNGKIIAGTLVKEFKNTVSFPFTCSYKDRETGDSPFYFMYWTLIKHFADNGKEIFHSGRIPINNSTDIYRLGWGGKRYGYYYQYYPKRDAKTEFHEKRSKKRELLETVWKNIPEPLIRGIGPCIVRRFP